MVSLELLSKCSNATNSVASNQTQHKRLPKSLVGQQQLGSRIKNYATFKMGSSIIMKECSKELKR